MRKGRLGVLAAVAVSLLGIVSATGVWAAGQGPEEEQQGGAAAANRPVQPVEVVNDDTTPVPVEVLGTALVEGAVEATQSGDWTVGISGTPSVAISGTPKVETAPSATTVLSTGDKTLGAGYSAGWHEFDATSFSAIRIVASCTGSGADCARTEVSLYDISCGCHLGELKFPDFGASALYEVPGQKITIGGHNGGTGSVGVRWKVFGRV